MSLLSDVVARERNPRRSFEGMLFAERKVSISKHRITITRRFLSLSYPVPAFHPTCV
jgi:hypothetical protein